MINNEIKELAENGELLTISPNIKDKNNLYYLSLENVLESIKRGEIKEYSDNPFSTIEIKSKVEEIRNETDYNKQNDLKVKNLPVFYSGGILNGKVEILCNTIFIDIDDYDFSQYDFIIKTLKSFPQVYTIFSTPRNKYRLKVGIKHNLKDPELFSDLYKDISKRLNDYFSDYNLKVDSSCSNPNKPIFFSYDPNIWINYEFEEFEFTKDQKEIIDDRAIKEIDLRKNETNNDDEYWVYSEVLGNGKTKYNTSKGYFSTGNIDKAIFDSFRFNYWNNDDFGKFEPGNRGNWIYKVSRELFQYIDDYDKVVELLENFNNNQIERLDDSEIESVCNNSFKAYKNKKTYNELGCRRNYAITKVAGFKRNENINKRKGNER